jgi:stringent starvation protein B
MTSQKPYLIRAIYDWLRDNHITPYLLVNATIEGVQVPMQFVHDGKIVLNIADDAVRDFHADNEWISFSARFSGQPMELFIPITAVLAIYGKENNEGMFFSEDEHPSPPTPPKPKADKTNSGPKRNAVGLRVVK